MIGHTEMKIALDANTLKIQFCNKSLPFAKAKADLGQLLTLDAENLQYGQRSLSNGNDILGTIKGTFILEREQCILCKLCNTHFKPKTILKHVKGSKIS